MKIRELLKFSTDAEILKDQINNGVVFDRIISGNPNVDSEGRDLLSRNRDELVKVLTAGSAETAVETLLRLSRDESPIVRAAAILNKNTPEDVYNEVVLKDPDLFWALRSTGFGPSPLLFSWSMHRSAVKGWDRRPAYDLNRVIESIESIIPEPLMLFAGTDQETPLRTLKSILTRARHNDYLAMALVRNKNSSTEILREFADSDNDMIRFEVAKNTDDPELYALMKKATEPFVRLGVGLNPLADPSIIKKIRDDRTLNTLNVNGEGSDFYSPVSMSTSIKNVSYEDLRRFYYSPKDLSVSILAHLARLEDTPESQTRSMLQGQSLDEVEKEMIRLFTSYNLGASPDLLRWIYEVDEISSTLEYDLWLGLALNPNTPYSVLESIIENGDSNLNLLITQNPNYNFDEYIREFLTDEEGGA